MEGMEICLQFPHIYTSNRCESEKYFYLPKFLVDDTKLEVIADDMFIKCNNELGSLGDGEKA